MNRSLFEKALVENSIILKEIRKRADEVHTVNVNHHYGDYYNAPYTIHLDRVAEFFTKYGYEVIDDINDILPCYFAAYFHDSIEDARLNYTDVKSIASELGLNNSQAILAAELVYALTDEKGRTRKERENEIYFKRLQDTKYGTLMKACDRAANMSFAYECSIEVPSEFHDKKSQMYKTEMKHFLMSLGSSGIPKDLLEYLSLWVI